MSKSSPKSSHEIIEITLVNGKKLVEGFVEEISF